MSNGKRHGVVAQSMNDRDVFCHSLSDVEIVNSRRVNLRLGGSV